MSFAVTPPITLAPPVFFLSDAHLGAVHGQEGEKQRVNLDTFLTLVQKEGKSLCLVGDLFDFWYEWKYVIPKQHFHVLFRLRQLVDQGISIHYFAGNHDFRLHGFLENEIGLVTHLDAQDFQIGAQKIFVWHGDGILKSDSGYRLLKKILRSAWAQKMFSWIHPDVGMLLARGTSMTSRNSEKGKPEEDGEYESYARKKFDEGYDGVVLGHSHRAREVQEGAKTYINLGDWIIHFTYAAHDGKELKLIKLNQTT